jgi:hypothetical protein
VTTAKLAAAVLGICAVVTFGVTAAGANTYAQSSPLVDVSAGLSPFASCTADDPATQQTFSRSIPALSPSRGRTSTRRTR